MSKRIAAARFLIRCGGFIESLAVAWMRPSDLMEFNRRHEHVWSHEKRISKAAIYELANDERALLRELPVSPSRILLLGDGREKSALIRGGHDVTWAREIQPAGNSGRFDAVWLGGIYFSKIPGLKMRAGLLRQIEMVLRPGGCLVCQFLVNGWSRVAAARFRRLFALLTLGNLQLQQGDAIRELREFSHTFSSWDELQAEFQASGFEIIFSQMPPATVLGGAIAKVRKFG